MDNSTEMSDVFSEVAAQLLAAGKTVIVVSQDDEVLRHCHIVHLLRDGRIGGNSESYEQVKVNPVYEEIVRKSRNKRDVLKYCIDNCSWF